MERCCFVSVSRINESGGKARHGASTCNHLPVVGERLLVGLISKLSHDVLFHRRCSLSELLSNLKKKQVSDELPFGRWSPMSQSHSKLIDKNVSHAPSVVGARCRSRFRSSSRCLSSFRFVGARRRT